MDRIYTVEISLKTLLKTCAFIGVLGVIWLLRDIVMSLFLALLLAGLLYPLVRWAERRSFPKALVVGGLLFSIVALGIALIALLVPAVVEQAGLAAQSLQEVLATVQLGALREAISFNDIMPNAQAVLTKFASGIDVFAQGITGIVIVVVLAFYLLLEEATARDAFRQWIPTKYQQFVITTVWAVVEKLGQWVRGQSLLSGVIAISYFIGYSIIGVPYAFLLALLAGLFEFVPYIGPLFAALPALVFALGQSPWQALATVIFLIVVQQLQNHIIVPLVMRKAVGLRPVISVLSFLIGAKLFGIAGALFAIPVATALSVVIQEYRTAFSPET